MVFTGREDCIKCLELTAARYREELETVGKLSGKDKITLQAYDYQESYKLPESRYHGLSSGVNQAITILKRMLDRKYSPLLTSVGW